MSDDPKNQPAIPELFLSPYEPSTHEDRVYAAWEASGFFNPDTCIKAGIAAPDAETFSIVLPPPNVTGTLHMGHAAMLAVEDILVRYHRMNGKRTLWIPGTDSAAIATQSKVEKDIQKNEGKSRHDLGREELLRRVSEFAENSKDTILNQTRKMGSSLDWSRYAYTLDEPRYKAVMTAFVRMYEDGLIYRGNRIVNWDPKGQTTISDDEIVYEERKSTLYTFKYSPDFPISISTTRPETKVGDVAVAVHPDDERYKNYVGKSYSCTFCDVPITVTIIADAEVDPTFGTGALGVTPAHSKIDWEIANRHNLSHRPQVINEYAKMTVAGRLSGLKVETAREAVVAWLTETGLLEKAEPITQNVSTAERTGAIIEPLPKLQWWISVNKKFTLPHSEIPGVPSGSEVTLKELMVAAVEHGSTDIYPERFKRTYFNWIENLQDWCISRQIWFGHRIPVWYRDDEVYCDVTPPPGEGWEQDPDTLDTWFSSGLWTFSTLGWPEETPDLKTYHPTTVLETGYDIIFFWVARMILMSTYHLGQVPFKNVYLHGLVRDDKNRKMSKSLGNIIDPLDLIAKYGADAVRLSLIIGAAPGNDVPLSEQKTRGYKHFTNKVWNITRFILTHTSDYAPGQSATLSPRDKEILAQLNSTVAEISGDIEKFSLHLAAEKTYHYVWHELADKILEESKPLLTGDDAEARTARQQVLNTCLVTSLKLLHPFMPFVTETIWQELPPSLRDNELLLVSAWPRSEQKTSS
jgi:valyl-tRNA synthetase